MQHTADVEGLDPVFVLGPQTAISACGLFQNCKNGPQSPSLGI